MLSPEAKHKIQKHIMALPPSLQSEPATDTQLQEFEAIFDSIPEDYRWFLTICGGGIFGSERLDSIADLAESHSKFQREFGAPHGWTMENIFIIG